MPAQKIALGLSEVYTDEEFEGIEQGFLPLSMEDKWFAFFEEPWLYIHRSWTGDCIFAIRFEKIEGGYATAESWVNDDEHEYKESNLDVKRFWEKN